MSNDRASDGSYTIIDKGYMYAEIMILKICKTCLRTAEKNPFCPKAA